MGPNFDPIETTDSGIVDEPKKGGMVIRRFLKRDFEEARENRILLAESYAQLLMEAQLSQLRFRAPLPQHRAVCSGGDVRSLSWVLAGRHGRPGGTANGWEALEMGYELKLMGFSLFSLSLSLSLSDGSPSLISSRSRAGVGAEAAGGH